MENEIWRSVVGYEGLYDVSNLGRVRALRWRGGHKIHIIHHRVRKNGYVEVQLISNKHTVYHSVHRLVAKAFIPIGKRVSTAERSIIMCCREEIRKAYGFIWVYKGKEANVPRLVERNKPPKSIRVKMTFPDGRVVFYDSVNQASKETGIMNNTIRYSRYHTKRHISWELLNEDTCYSRRISAR